jgi:hypothetical protein
MRKKLLLKQQRQVRKVKTGYLAVNFVVKFMEVNKLVLENIKQLVFKQQMLFGLSCVDRCIEMYKLFDKMVIEEKLEPLVPNNNGFEILNEILNEGYNLIDNIEIEDNDKIQQYVKQCYELAPHDEDYGDIQTTIAQFAANSLAYSLKFYLEKDLKYLNWCSDSVIEIINIIESEKFYESNPDDDAEKHLDICFEKEVKIQMEVIQTIFVLNNLSDFRNYLKDIKLSI